MLLRIGHQYSGSVCYVKRSLKFCCLLKSNHEQNFSDLCLTTNRSITTAFGFQDTVSTFMLTSRLTCNTDASEFKFANAGSSS